MTLGWLMSVSYTESIVPERKKNVKLEFSKIKNCAKDTAKKKKIQVTDCENVFAKYVTYKAFISNIYKKKNKKNNTLLKLNKKKKNNQLKNEQMISRYLIKDAKLAYEKTLNIISPWGNAS